MSTQQQTVPIKEFVTQMEQFSVDLFKQCMLKTNQFSAKYILQQVIRDQEENRQKILPALETLGPEGVNRGSLQYSIEGFCRQHVDDRFDLGSLNFVEATQLAILVVEYIIEKYQLLMQEQISEESKKAIHTILAEKQTQLDVLKKEYEQRRYK